MLSLQIYFKLNLKCKKITFNQTFALGTRASITGQYITKKTKRIREKRSFLNPN